MDTENVGKNHEVLKLLTDFSNDRSWINRYLGAQLAGQRNIHAAENILFRLLNDPSEWVRYHSFLALVTLKADNTRLLTEAQRLSSDVFHRLRAAAQEFVAASGTGNGSVGNAA